MSTPYKQSKMNTNQANLFVLQASSKEKLDNESTNVGIEKTAKAPLIFVARVDNFSLFSKLLKEFAASEYEIKIINSEQIKIQPELHCISKYCKRA